MSYDFRVNFEIAEVINVEKLQTDIDPENLYSLSVELFDTSTVQHDIQVRPVSFNIQSPPIKGELILIFNGPNQYSGNKGVEPQWYYLCTLPVQSSIYQNMLLGAAGSRDKYDETTGENINETNNEGSLPNKKVNPLQPFTGDILMQGRFGNSIRLGSSIIESDNTVLKPNWIGEQSLTNSITDPIIILSNTTTSTDTDDPYGRKYIIENIETDVSSLYLTTSQQLSTLKLNKNSDKSGGFSKFNQSQLVGVADRIVLTSKRNSIILDSASRITCNADEILLGSESASEPLVHGNELILVLLDIIEAIQQGTFGTGAIYSTPTPAGDTKLTSALNRLKSLNSSKYFMKK